MKQETIPYFDVSSPYDIAYRKNIASYPVGPHTHNAAELYLTHTFLPDVLIDDKVSQVPAGSLIVIPPFCVHQLYHRSDVIYERYILSVHSTWLEQVLFGDREQFSYLKPGAVSLILPLSEAFLEKLTLLFQSSLRTQCGDSIDSILTLFSLLQYIDEIVNRTRPDHSKCPCTVSNSQRHVNEMIAYINEHLCEPLTLNQLAGHFFLNPDYLSRLFRKHTHTTVGHYITLQKITRAQAMLREGISITEIQETLGFSGYAHFAKVFKKLTGMTPGQYREAK